MAKKLKTPKVDPSPGVLPHDAQRRAQLRVTKLFGAILFTPGFNHKMERAKR